MKSMKYEKPAVGSVVKVSVNNEAPYEAKILGYFDETRSVFLYEGFFTPTVEEWDDVMWREIPSLVKEMEKDFEDWNEWGLETYDKAEFLIERGWRKE